MTDIQARLDEIDELGLTRRMRLVSGPQGPRVVLDGKPVLLLCSNNYLGLADHPRVREAAADAAMRWGVGAGASRLVSGTMTVHRRLEDALAAFKEREAAVLYGSGYLANTGVVSALAGHGEVVFSDELNHASLIDGCRLARAETVVYRHNDVEHLAWCMQQAGNRGAVVVTDSVFSMDGDEAPLAALVAVAASAGALLVVDEAHAVLGPEVPVDGRAMVVRVGTLSKALGSLGGWVAGDGALIDLLVNRARPHIFSTGLPPADAAAALAALAIVRSEEGDALRGRLRRHIEAVAPGRPSPIIPLVVGDEDAALKAADALLERGILVPAIRPPTVAPGTSRLRVALSAAHTTEMVDELVTALAEIGLVA
jgi:glycine C-acetyltransferase/8-amino-7-oxononanoate synthase